MKHEHELYTLFGKRTFDREINVKLMLDSFRAEYVYFERVYKYKIHQEALRMCIATKMLYDVGDSVIDDYAEISTSSGDGYVWDDDLLPVGFKSKTELIVYKLFEDEIIVLDISSVEELVCEYDFSYYEKYLLKLNMLDNKEKTICINGEVYGEKAPYRVGIRLSDFNSFPVCKGVSCSCLSYDKIRDLDLKGRYNILDLFAYGCNITIHDSKCVYLSASENGSISIESADTVILKDIYHCKVVLHKGVKSCFIYMIHIEDGDWLDISVECPFENLKFFTTESFTSNNRYIIYVDSIDVLSTDESVRAAFKYESLYSKESLKLSDDVSEYYEKRKKEVGI